ncbi:mRNA splicing factor [Coccidioides immitis RS]|uniref:Pre-mRNA-splicing factor 18 n=2 Tax=Coccidioides TaxID=5500 RepID=A0A0D8JUF9_COCIM|nr:mRNA splicing factor [Coccidioides immitis RS]KJF60591.1 mRNA splicing factor [Coccidioides immitis RS]TPX23905.1 mRNA splicing protein prp18 [Coccidioides immitis]
MDFASLMSKEIAKSKPPAKQSSQAEQNQQYVRRSELETARVAAYNAEQERLQREREERAERKRKLDEEEAERNRIREEKRRRLAEESRRRREAEEAAKEAERRKRLGLSVTPAEENGESGKEQTPLEGEEVVGQEEVVEKLRSVGEPIRLFGESDKGRLKRYRRLVQRSATPQKQLSDGPIPTTLELLPEAEMKVPDKVPEDEEGKKYLFRQLASYFTMVLKEWEIALSKRDDSVKSTFQGRQAYNAMVQSRDNMKPLFKKFENADVEEGILGPIVEIVRNAQNRRYVDANDGYLRLSIGKAAWPIGVTMVGIHERSAREKLHEGGQDKAHIMSDEITRKFLQSIKRCLTFAQVRWPPDDQLQLMG